MFFETSLLCSYNYLFRNCFMINCKCYEQYATMDKLVENIIEKRWSYVSCLCYESIVRNRIGHGSIPIILGSYLDFCIRGEEAVQESRPQWGLLILKGIYKVYSNFSTFDSLSMHVRETKTLKTIDWFTYVEDDGLALSYCNNTVTWTYKRQTSTSNDWVHLLEKSNPFGTPVSYSDYKKMFDTILKYPYSMNDLKNRQILNAPTAMMKYIMYDLRRRRTHKAGCNLRKAFDDGSSLFLALSKQNTLENQDWNKNYSQNYDNTLHDGRSNKAIHLLHTIIRAFNAAVRNSSNALAFAIDALWYFCLLTTKDLKSAGEQNALADFVTMNEETDQMALYRYLKLISNENGEHIITINGYLIECRANWDLNQLILVKKRFPHVTTMYHLPYIRFSTRANIPIKYSEQYDTFFSPAETTHFNLTYPEADMLSVTVKQLPMRAVAKTPAAKNTVSVNNLKGSIAMLTSRFHQLVMENSQGVTCYMKILKEFIEKLPDFAIISHNNDTSFFHKFYDELNREFQLEENAQCEPASTNPEKAMRALDRLYPPEDLLMECQRTTNAPFKKTRNYGSIERVKRYRSMIFSGKNYKAPDIWNLKLRVAFGNPHGDCIEDGVVLDSEVAKHIPPVHYNACITVEFTFNTVKQPKESKFFEVDGSINDLMIGYLVTEHDCWVKQSRHTKVTTFNVGQHKYHLISFKPKETKMYDNIKVRHICKNNSITIVITGQTQVSVGIGSKLANGFGQKNIISNIMDLRGCNGVTRDGKRVHAQLIYSKVSLVGRVTSGQLYDMFLNNELAIGDDGTIIAPVYEIVHTMHPYCNIKIMNIKVDTLTDTNGFTGQNLCCVSNFLRSEYVYNDMVQILGFHGYDVHTQSEEAENFGVHDECTDEYFDEPVIVESRKRRRESDDRVKSKKMRKEMRARVMGECSRKRKSGDERVVEVKRRRRDENTALAAITGECSRKRRRSVERVVDRKRRRIQNRDEKNLTTVNYNEYSRKRKKSDDRVVPTKRRKREE